MGDNNMDIFEIAGRTVIVILNFFFFLIATVLIVFGCLVKFGAGALNRYLQPILESVQKLASEENVTYTLGNIHVGDIINEAATVAIVFGSILLCIAIFGWCGACCRVPWMMSLYCAILTVLLAGQVALLILIIVVKTKVEMTLKEPLKDTLKYKYTGIDAKDAVSISWNYIMNSLECCGVQDYRDFTNSTSWDRIYHDPNTKKSYKLKMPLVCCKLEGSYPNIKPPSDISCALRPNRATTNYHKGCYDQLWRAASTAEIIIIGVLALAALFQMLLIFLSIYLIGKMREIKT